MSIPRRLEPEWLDQLPADDPRAIRSRRDLRRVNAWMFNASRMSGALLKYAGGERPDTIADLGSGDGAFMLQVAGRLARHWPNVAVVLQDKQNIVSRATRESYAALGWRVEVHSADVFEFLAQAHSVDIMTCNLFLHHFAEEQLIRLLTLAARLARLVVACEPRRSKFVVEASRLLWAIGCNQVSVHDAVISARAGFKGRELSALWPREPQWELHEQAAGLFTHCFVARHSAPAAVPPSPRPQLSA